MQRENIEKKMVQKRNAMHAIVDQTVDKVNMVNMIWQGEVLPSALYGCEVITMTKTLLNKLNIQQNETLRGLFKAHKSTNGAVLRREMGWFSVEGEIYKRKLNFWYYLCKMLKEERWARKVFVESKRYQTKWIVENIKAEI